MADMGKILFATDFSENSKWALRYALSFAKQYKGKLYILHVIQPPNYPLGTYSEISFEAMDKFGRDVSEVAERDMKRLCEEDLEGFKNYESFLINGTAFLEIIKMAKEKEVDMIVVGTHGRTGLRRALVGSVTEQVIRTSSIPVLTVRLSPARPPARARHRRTPRAPARARRT